MQLPRIDQNSEQGQELQKVVQTKLKDFLGAEYADDVLPLYIVVMLAHGNNQSLVTENLEAFLGVQDSAQFAKWLFAHLEEHGEKYAAPEPEAEPEDDMEPDEEEAGRAEDGGTEEHEEPDADVSPPDDRKQERGRERHKDAIEWRKPGSSSRHHRAGRPRDEKRGRGDELSRHDRHASHHREKEAEEGRDTKRRKHDMRELRPLQPGREERGRDRERPRNDERHSREERDRERYEWERQQKRESQRMQMDRERELRAHREMRDRDRDHARDRLRDRDRDLDMRPRQRAYMDSYKAEPIVVPSASRRAEDEDSPFHDEIGGRTNGHDDRLPPLARREPPSVKSRTEAVGKKQPEADAEADATRSNVFDRLGRNKERPYLSPAAARKSVFDRLRGNRVAAPKEEEVDPEAVTDDDLAEEGPPAGHVTKDKPRVGLQPGVIATKALSSIKPAEAQGKEENMAEMRRKMMELQEQVRQLERQQVMGSASALTPLAAAGAAGAAVGLPAVDPRSVHVQGVSPLAVPEVIAAHFSGCGMVMNVTIARDLQGNPRGFAHVEFSNELEAQNALSLSGSILLQQPITVTPKINRPQPALAPHLGRGRGGFGVGRGAPFSPRGRGAYRGRGGRAPQPNPTHNNKYIRPELRAQLQKQNGEVSQLAATS
ncbi:g4251 [Coccomyxa elongata]